MADLFEFGALENLDELARRWPAEKPKRRETPPELLNGRLRTCAEVAALLAADGDQISRQAVDQIERRALVKCKRWAERHGFKLEDLLGL